MASQLPPAAPQAPTAAAAASPGPQAPAVARPLADLPVAPTPPLVSRTLSEKQSPRISRPSLQVQRIKSVCQEDRKLPHGHDATLKDQAVWAAHTQSHLKAARALRGQLQREVKNNVAVCGEFAAPGTLEEPSSSGGRSACSFCSNTAAEDRLKRRKADEKNITEALQDRMEATERAIFQILQSANALQRAGGMLLAALGVADKRLELRSTRPPAELVRDIFQEALEHEGKVLVEARSKLANQVEAGQDALAPLLEAREAMQQGRRTLHLDRTGQVWRFLDRVRELEDAALRFSEATTAALASEGRKTDKARGRTIACMKRRVAQTLELRRQLEAELKETHTAVQDTERRLERMQRRLRQYREAPERSLDGQPTAPEAGRKGATSVASTATTATPSPPPPSSSPRIVSPALWGGKFAKLRAKVKAAAYTGQAGRELAVVFGRFDRDGSGELDEDEVRSALRRTLKVPTSVISDAEISLLVSMLDSDGSGSVSIVELVDFLSSDLDVEALDEQIASTSAMLHKLRAGQEQMIEDLRCKTAAWKIDESCQRVTPIKGLDLDTGLLPQKTSEELLSARKLKPLKPELLEVLRSRIKAASYTGTSGRQLDVIFSRFDKDGSGLLEDEEVRQALRRTLRIPPSVFSDEHITSLCSMLDPDKSGSVSVAELVDFVGVDSQVSKRTGRMLGGRSQSRERMGQDGSSSDLDPSSQDLEDSKLQPTPPASASPARPRPRPGLSSDVLESVRSKFKAAAYTGSNGRELGVVFSRFDKDRSGQLDHNELLAAVRKILKISPKVIPDTEIKSLCRMLDVSRTGTITISDLVAFVGAEPEVSQRTGRRLPPAKPA